MAGAFSSGFAKGGGIGGLHATIDAETGAFMSKMKQVDMKMDETAAKGTEGQQKLKKSADNSIFSISKLQASIITLGYIILKNSAYWKIFSEYAKAALGKTATDVMTTVPDAFRGMVGGIKDTWKGFWDNNEEASQAGVNKVADSFLWLSNWLSTNPVFEVIGNDLIQMSNRFVKKHEEDIRGLSPTYDQWEQNMTKPFRAMGDTMGEFKRTVGESLDGVRGNLKSWLDGIDLNINLPEEQFASFDERIKGFIRGENLSGWVDGMGGKWDSFKERLSGVSLDSFSFSADNFVKGAGKRLRDCIDGIGERFEKAKEKAKDFFENIKENAGDALDKLLGSGG